MKNTIWPFLILQLCIGCSSVNETKIQKLTSEEVLSLQNENRLVLAFAKYVDEDENPLSPELTKKLNNRNLGRDFYGTIDGRIEKVIVRPISLEDKFFEIRLGTLTRDYFNQIQMIEIDCNDKKKILEELYDKDQNARNGTGENFDFDNLNILVSLLEKCGFPTTEEVGKKGMEGIFFVLQHSNDDVMSYYFGQMENAVKRNDIKKSTFALMQDRLLMNFGYKQIYGTQIQNDDLYQLEDPLNVNQRRAKVGLYPIEEYLKHFDLNFKEELKKMEES